MTRTPDGIKSEHSARRAAKIGTVGAVRDPISELFNAGARRHLERAYARPGEWVETRLRPPGPRAVRYGAELGIDVLGPDDVSARGGRGLNAHTRWARAYVRALYYQHRWWSAGAAGFRQGKRTVPRHSGALEVDVGRQAAALGVIPAGRIVRVKFTKRRPEEAKRAHFRDQQPAERVYTPAGGRGARWSDPRQRDWHG